MTAQVPERIIIDGIPHFLNCDPLYRIFASRRISRFPSEDYTTACYRRYVGTWELVDGELYLVHMCLFCDGEEPLSEDQRQWMLRLVPAKTFPVFASWFNGRLMIPLGRRLAYVHRGWASTYERLRVVTMRHGKVVRDRIVDTGAIHEWRQRRDERFRRLMEGDTSDFPVAPLIWSTKDSKADDLSDWWPPDYGPEQARQARSMCSTDQ
ncbi:MAG: hypothetical protein KDJ37_09000 [Hyphomicrobiaceae bacterium]|nr:hypothetical protein [Hyphomicrobiaceae bacterium]